MQIIIIIFFSLNFIKFLHSRELPDHISSKRKPGERFVSHVKYCKRGFKNWVSNIHTILPPPRNLSQVHESDLGSPENEPKPDD